MMQNEQKNKPKLEKPAQNNSKRAKRALIQDKKSYNEQKQSKSYPEKEKAS